MNEATSAARRSSPDPFESTAPAPPAPADASDRATHERFATLTPQPTAEAAPARFADRRDYTLRSRAADAMRVEPTTVSPSPIACLGLRASLHRGIQSIDPRSAQPIAAPQRKSTDPARRSAAKR